MRTPVKYRMLRETIYFCRDQILRLETLSYRSGLNKSELIRIALESFLRFHGLRNPEFCFLPGDVEEEKVAARVRFQIAKLVLDAAGLRDQ